MEEDVNATDEAHRLAKKLDVDLIKLSQRPQFRSGKQITEEDVKLAHENRKAPSLHDVDIGVVGELAGEPANEPHSRAAERSQETIKESADAEAEETTAGAKAEDRSIELGGQGTNAMSVAEESSRESASNRRRLNVVFSEPAYNTLKEMAEQSGKTISEVVRDAIALQKWFTDTQRHGGRILVEERGRVREIMNVR